MDSILSKCSKWHLLRLIWDHITQCRLEARLLTLYCLSCYRLQSGCILKATSVIQERNPVVIHPTMTSVLSCEPIRVMPFGADMHKICCNKGFRCLRAALTLEIIHRSVQSSVPHKRIWMAIPGDSMNTSLDISWPLYPPMPSTSEPKSLAVAAARDSRRQAFSYREKGLQPSCHGRSPSPSSHPLL